MKFLLTEIAAILAINKASGEDFKFLRAEDPEGPKHVTRHLTGLDGYNFLISVREGDNNEEEYWCIESGTSDGDEAHLSKCDFDARPAKQLWLEDYSDSEPDCANYPWCSRSELQGWAYRLRSALGDQSKCLHIGHGGGAQDINDISRIRMVDCDIDSENKYFTLSFPPCDTYFGCTQHYQIRSANYESYCITNHQPPREGANMIVKECKDKDRFNWVGRRSYRAIWAENWAYAFCVGIRDDVAMDGMAIELKNCPSYNYYHDTFEYYTVLHHLDNSEFLVSGLSQLWTYDAKKGLFHSALRYDKCIMVGSGNVVNVGERKRLRIGDCNNYSPKNQFYWDSWVIHSSYDGYCVTHQGTDPHFGDPVIILNCNATPGAFERFVWDDHVNDPTLVSCYGEC